VISKWKKIKLGKMVNIKSGDSPSLYNLNDKGEIPYVKVEDLNNCRKYQIESRNYSQLNSKQTVPPGAVVFPKRGAAIMTNKVRLAKVPLYMDSNLMSVKADGAILDDEYLYYTISYEKLYRIADTSTIPQINNKHINPYKIPLPPLPEQKKIAEILGKWDDGIETVEKLIAAKKKLKKALMQQLLTSKKRFKEFEGQEWEEYPIGNLLKEIKRPVEFNDNELYELISIRRRSGGLFLRERLYGHQIKVKDLRDAHKGDFLISKMQVVRGALGLTTAEFNGMKISGSYIALIPRNPEKLDIEFYSFRTHLPDMYHKIYRSCYGVHIEKMTFNMKLYFQEKLLIPPSVKEQQKIALVLNAADKEIELLNNKLEALKNQKKGLMQKLLTGKTRVNV